MKTFTFFRVLFPCLCIIGGIGLSVLIASGEISNLLSLNLFCGLTLIGLVGNAVCAFIVLHRSERKNKKANKK